MRPLFGGYTDHALLGLPIIELPQMPDRWAVYITRREPGHPSELWVADYHLLRVRVDVRDMVRAKVAALADWAGVERP